MVVYNFRTLKPVPTAPQLLDIVLSRTQRKTATEVHKRYSIQRIRQFYMKKVKYTQSTFHERLSEIVDEFPRLDTIHPFYADLINVLYDRDHYKLALGQLNQARTLIDNVAKDYVRLLKFGDSLYRCKLLKRAGLGRMATIVKKMKSSLGYLEQVRQHLSRLPSIDPSARTLLLTGYPNAGKSSFMNQITRADVDVQPYAFTTKSLFVGHTDYKYLRWQVIDTPGILDHPLEDRNTIEMQSITALAHLQCAVLFMIDISGAGEYSIRQQLSLFQSIKPLFANKPLVLVANKTDLCALADLDDEDRQLLEASTDGGRVPLVPMSNVSLDGIQSVKSAACDLLLDHRLSTKLRSSKIDTVRHRIQIAQPVPRDNKKRPVCIPESVQRARALKADGMADAGATRKTARQIEAENGGAGIFNFNMRQHWELAEHDWTLDVVPEIFNGKNVADYFDADIEERLNALEREEEQIRDDMLTSDEESDLDPEQVELASRIHRKKAQLKLSAQAARTITQPSRKRDPKTVGQFAAHLDAMGVDSSAVRVRGRKRVRAADTTEPMAVDVPARAASASVVARSQSKMRRNRSMTPGKATAFKDESGRAKAAKVSKLVQRKTSNLGRAGEGDRVIRDAKPKWLFSGKRGIGKTDRR